MSNGGIGTLGVLLIIFITLKVLNLIDWSWWWVFSPIWIPFLIILGFVFIFLVGAAILNWNKFFGTSNGRSK